MSGQQFYSYGAHHDDGAAWWTGQNNYPITTVPGTNKLTRVEVRGLIAYQASSTFIGNAGYFDHYFQVGIQWVLNGDPSLNINTAADQILDQWFYLGAPKQSDFLDVASWPSTATGVDWLPAQSFALDVRPQLWCEAATDLTFSIGTTSASAPGFRFFGTYRTTFATGRLS